MGGPGSGRHKGGGGKKSVKVRKYKKLEPGWSHDVMAAGNRSLRAYKGHETRLRNIRRGKKIK